MFRNSEAGTLMSISETVRPRDPSKEFPSGDPTPPRRIRMSRSQYLETDWPDGERVEWADGWAIIMNSPISGHQRIASRLVQFLGAALPGCIVVQDMSITLADTERIPDVMVVDLNDWDDHVPRVLATPLIVAEVLSASTWRTDLTQKAAEYAKEGIGQYWAVDHDIPMISVFALNSDGYGPAKILSAKQPELELEVPGHGTIALKLDQIFGLPVTR